MFGPTHAKGLRRIAVAVLSGLLVSWFGVGALIVLSLAWPHNPTPRLLLMAWIVLALGSLAIPGASVRFIRRRGLLVVMAVPFVPFARAAVVVWPHLPRAVRARLEGSPPRRRPGPTLRS
jgi:hypothetical protein